MFAIAEEEEENLYFQLQAEAATKVWEDKLYAEVGENVKTMLKVSTQFESNKLPGLEAPQLVIDDVIKLEKRAMRKKVRYLEYFTHKSQREQEEREAQRLKQKAEAAAEGGKS